MGEPLVALSLILIWFVPKTSCVWKWARGWKVCICELNNIVANVTHCNRLNCFWSSKRHLLFFHFSTIRAWYWSSCGDLFQILHPKVDLHNHLQYVPWGRGKVNLKTTLNLTFKLFSNTCEAQWVPFYHGQIHVITCIIKCEIKLLTHFQTSTVAPFGNG